MRLLILNFLIILNTTASENLIKKYQSVFTNLSSIEQQVIADTISDKPINTLLLIARNNQSQTIGYIREVNTTTGCDSACLPVVFTLYYDVDLSLIKLKSGPGLTKRFHIPFTKKDYEKLDIILMINPKNFQDITHPTQMVDAISGATIKKYKEDVVSTAAYTSLRVNAYHQQTLIELKKIKAQKVGP